VGFGLVAVGTGAGQATTDGQNAIGVGRPGCSGTVHV